MEINFPNRWEANYYRYIKWLGDKGKIRAFRYQPPYFVFPVEFGHRRYRPDFLVVGYDRTYYIEIKGYMDSASKTKLKRMKKYFPDVEVRLVTATEMRNLNNTVGKLIEGWER